MTLRKFSVGLLLLAFVPSACGDSSSGDDDGGNEAGADNAGEGGTSGSSGANGGGTSGKGGTAGTSGSDTGGTSGAAGEGSAGEPTGGTGAEGGSDDGGDGGMAGEPVTGGTGGAGMGGAAGRGMAGGGMGGAGTSGGGNGGMGGAGVIETNCTDGMDNDGDTNADCADNDCALHCSLGTCPAGTTPQIYTATGLPTAIPDNMPSNPAFSPITIATLGLVGKISVQTSITHPYVGDLTLSLVTPYGVRQLATRIGSSGVNYTRTVFSDGATTSITAGTAPFTGTFRPQQELGAVSGATLAGTYGLRVSDGGAADSGQLRSFSLAVCQCLAASGNCEFGPYACENGVDDDGDGLVDCQESACATSPSCPRVEHACGDGVDNDGDGAVDCADTNCSWACTALGSACTGANRLYTYQTRNVPQAIGTTAAAFPAPIYASASGTVVASAVRFSATHAFTADLDLTVMSPSGTLRGLTSDNGDDGINYTNTVFLDSATTAITAGTAPFTGSFRPEEPLSAWATQPAAGYWFGELVDDAASDGGSFTELSLGLCVAP